MFNIVLYAPEIPANTGNIGRTCVVTGARLHLVEPLGFSLDDKTVRRAGLSYWQNLDVTTYASWEDFLVRNDLSPADERLHLLTKKARVSVNIISAIFANVFPPIAPTRMRRIRQRGCAAFGV